MGKQHECNVAPSEGQCNLLNNNDIQIISHNVHTLHKRDPTKLNCLLHNICHRGYTIALLTETTLNGHRRSIWEMVHEAT